MLLDRGLVHRPLLARGRTAPQMFVPRVPGLCPVDGPEGWFVPQNPWHFIQLGLAVPDFLWLCQEGTGSLTNSIGTALPLDVNGTGHVYQQSITGWGRRFVGTAAGVAGAGWRTSSALLDLANGESCALVIYAAVNAAANGFVAGVGGSSFSTGVASTGVLRTFHNGTGFNGAVDHNSLTTVRQFALYRNATTNVSGSVTNLEAVSATHNEAALTGGVKALGSSSTTNSIDLRACWFAIYKGANAERDWAAYLTVLRG